MNMKKLATLVSAVALSATVSANAMAKDTIALVISTLNNPFFVSLKDGAQKEADKLGYNLVVLDSQNNPAKELANVQDLTVRGTKILLINPTDSDAVGNAIKMANQAKIPVITLDRVASKGEVVSHIASDNVLGGKIAGDYIAKKAGEGAKVIELQGIAGTSAARERGEGFQQAVAAHKFNVLASQPADFDRTKGLNVMQNLLTAHPDVKVGSLLALTGAVAASIVGIEVNALVAVAAALALGAAIGAVTGVIVAKGRVQAFIATLVMMLLLRGVTMVYTNGSPVNTGFTDNADVFGWFGIGRPLGIPTPVWIMGIVFLAAWYMLHHTRLGRYIYALGGNEAATRLSGISVNKVKIIVYSLCGLLSALAGIIEVARLSSAQPTAGTGYELDAIAAVVLGGTSLAGGKGRIVGTLIGALILGFLNNGLNLLGVSSYYQMIVKAVVILLAVLVDNKKQ